MAKYSKLIGTAIAFAAAGFAALYPAHATEFASAAAFLFGALHVQRPGDVKAGS